MKTLLFPFVWLLLILAACGKQASDDLAGNLKEETASRYYEPTVTAKAVSMEGSGLVLPKGTKVRLARDSNEIEIELPKGYTFFTEKTLAAGPVNGKKLPVITLATYRCECAVIGGNPCGVFYHSGANSFGCLHKNCQGSCIGSLLTKEGAALGVLTTLQEDMVTGRTAQVDKAILTPEGMAAFVSSTFVQQQVGEKFKWLIGQPAMKAFNGALTGETLPADAVYIPVQWYGVSFYLAAPRQAASARYSTEIIEPSSASCNCAEAPGTCNITRKKFLLYTLYWCSGTCRLCDLTVK